MGHENQVVMGAGTPIEMSMTVSEETYAKINELAEKIHGSRNDVFARALALLALAVEKRDEGQRLAVIDADNHVALEITGI